MIDTINLVNYIVYKIYTVSLKEINKKREIKLGFMEPKQF